jgi:AP2 domain
VGISRIEQPSKNNFGYYVRLTRQGTQYAKFFADKRYGGKRKALKAARDLYHELVEVMPPAKSSVGRKTVRNTSGVVGVSRTKSTRKGHTYEYWQAWWGSGEERQSVKFSILKYGEDEARQLAVKARKKWEREAMLT